MPKAIDRKSFHRNTTPYGDMVSYGPDDLTGKSIAWYGEWAANEISFLNHFLHEGDTVVDIGANIGYHMRAFSERLGPSGCVHAVEANPLFQNLLLRNIELARNPNISVHLCELGPLNMRVDSGRAETHHSDHFSASTSGPKSADQAEKPSLPVKSLDSLRLSGIRLLKINVESSEIPILQGSFATIAKSRPFIFCKVKTEEAATALANLSLTISYRAYSVNAFGHANFKEQEAYDFDGANDLGVFLTPIERRHEVESLIATKTINGLSISRLGPDHPYTPEEHPDILPRPIYIAVSFYKSPDLINYMLEGLLGLESELSSLNAHLLIYNDSPNHFETKRAFELAAKHYAHHLPASFHTNPRNLGLVETMNLALAKARRDGADLLLLNSSAMPARGALTELLAVSRIDPMIGFVCPRSNNAAISSIGSAIAANPTKSDLHSIESCLRPSLRALPRFQYAPVAADFCLLIKFNIIDNFGFLSLDQGVAFNEQVDYIMRAGQAGYRTAIANWAYCFRAGDETFSDATHDENAIGEIAWRGLDSLYPELQSLVSAYATSHRIISERFLETLASKKTKLVVDTTALGKFHNGTTFLNVNLIRSIARLYGDTLDICLIGEENVLQFHGLRRLRGVRFALGDITENFDIALRIGQPFSRDDVVRMAQIAAVNIYFMLDTIAQDCVQLKSPEVDEIWEFVANSADGIVFNSCFTQRQFQLRYGCIGSESRSLVSYHSLSIADYASVCDESNQSVDYEVGILIIGNHFPHKAVDATYKLLVGALPSLAYTIVSGRRDDALTADRGDIWFKSGELSEKTMQSLYANCNAVVFPSHYEGFGFPILQALAAGKPVFVRDNPVNREIMEATESKNIHPYKSESDLLAMISRLPAWITENTESSLQTWESSAVEVVIFCLKRLNAVSIEAIAQRTKNAMLLMSGDLLGDKLGRRRLQAEPTDFVRTTMEGVRSGRYVGELLSDLNNTIMSHAGQLFFQPEDNTSSWGVAHACKGLVELGDFESVFRITSVLLMKSPGNISLLEQFVISDLRVNYGYNAIMLLDRMRGLSLATEGFATAYFDALVCRARYQEAFFHIAEVLKCKEFDGFLQYCEIALLGLMEWDDQLLQAIEEMGWAEDDRPIIDSIAIQFGV